MIEQIFVFVARDDDGQEDVMVWCEGGKFLPLLAYTWEAARELVPRADILAGASERPYRVLRLAGRQDVTAAGALRGETSDART